MNINNCAPVNTVDQTDATEDVYESGSEQNQLTDIVGEFLQSGFNVLRNASDDEMKKLLSTLNGLEDMFSDDTSPLATYILAALKIAKRFIEGGFYIKPQTAITIIHKVF